MSEYQRLLSHRIADAVRLAAGNLAPAEVGWGSVDAPEHLFNRRWLLKPGETVPSPFGGEEHALMNPGRNPKIDRPAGPTDPQVSFLAVRTPEGRPIALLANYSLHYIGGVPAGHVSDEGVDRWQVDRANRRVVLYRVPIERLTRFHVRDEYHLVLVIESCVVRAVAELLGKDPWDLAPERFRHF